MDGEVTAQATSTTQSDPMIHVKVLGWINLVFGALGGLAALIVLAVGGIAGAGAASQGEAEAGLAVGGIMTIVAIFIAILAIPQILAGIGLLKTKNWGRILAFIIGALNLLNLPFGTALGIYTFWALTRPEVTAAFQQN